MMQLGCALPCKGGGTALHRPDGAFLHHSLASAAACGRHPPLQTPLQTCLHRVSTWCAAGAAHDETAQGVRCSEVDGIQLLLRRDGGGGARSRRPHGASSSWRGPLQLSRPSSIDVQPGKAAGASISAGPALQTHSATLESRPNGAQARSGGLPGQWHRQASQGSEGGVAGHRGLWGGGGAAGKLFRLLDGWGRAVQCFAGNWQCARRAASLPPPVAACRCRSSERSPPCQRSLMPRSSAAAAHQSAGVV